MNQRERVRQYISDLLKQNASDDGGFNDRDSLVISGRLSSLDVVNVLSFLERDFDFAIDPSDFDVSRFDTVQSIMEMLQSQAAQ